MVDSFGTVMRQLRQDRGWSLVKLAAKVNWSPAAVGLIETGKRRATVDFALSCDRVFGTTPILTTLCGLTGEDNDMRRRALLGGFAAAAGVGAVGAYAAMADVLRRDLMEAAGVGDDWDAVIASFRSRLVSQPSATFGDELLTSLLSCRQQLSERHSVTALRASAHLSLLYALWMGYGGNMGTSHSYFRTAALLAEHSGDVDTQVYVLGRTASGGPYQGLTHVQTSDNIGRALALAGDTASAGVLEAHAAAVHLAALTGDLTGGRVSIEKMWQITDRLTDDEALIAQQRTVSFTAYLEGRLGTLTSAEKAEYRAEGMLSQIPVWRVDSQLYYALAQVRHRRLELGLEVALAAVSALRHPGRVIRLGVDDVLRALPAGYRSDLSDALRAHGTSGVKPWELVIT